MTRASRPPFPVHVIDGGGGRDAPQFEIGPVLSHGPRETAAIPHRHEFLEILYVREGRGTHIIDGTAHPIAAHRLYLVRRGQVHAWVTPAPLDGTVVVFDEAFLAGPGASAAVDFSQYPNMLCPGAGHVPRLERLLAAMADEYTEGDDRADPITRHLLSALLLLCQRFDGFNAPEGSRAGPSAELGVEFTKLVAEKASATLTVRSAAMRLGVTPGYLRELVAAQTGRTPGQIIRSAVLTEAQRLLANTDMSCAQVADRLGFEDASYFSRFFRREAGAPPSAYRKQARERYQACLGA
ncbi:AraC family transcriptional regulator [Spongiactinospora sp. TRM90649]|uniref:helix-turn-helix domain-containing protein n=1 Tax=Spongiactinospora sp. TRM90649 TaxID=3031114 RepID=UPI0023F9FD98|nr:AraC family transcriptional regulator [Spongiactinospora sp. TRM90649]MDF5758844.1 AraC family transcriptional regulator [Spongiactinospora sp. TRM90649]